MRKRGKKLFASERPSGENDAREISRGNSSARAFQQLVCPSYVDVLMPVERDFW